MSDPPDLLTLRQDQTEWNLAGRMQGQMDSPLTPLGRRQARRQGRILAEFGIDTWNWFVSPQGRARHTARIAAPDGARITVDGRLGEISLGRWDGQTFDNMRGERPELFEGAATMGWNDHAPGGEGLDAVARRTGAFPSGQRAPAVIVTHGITGRMLRGHALGLDPRAFGDTEGGQGVVCHLTGRTQVTLR